MVLKYKLLIKALLMMRKYLFSLTNSNMSTLWILIVTEIPKLSLKSSEYCMQRFLKFCVHKNQLVNLLKMQIGAIVDGLLGCTMFLTVMNCYEHFKLCHCGEHMYVFLQGVQLGVEFLHHQLVTQSALVENYQKVFQVAVSTYSPFFKL